VDVKWCQKLNHEFQSALVGLSQENVNVDSVGVPPGLKTQFSRYQSSAVVMPDRKIAPLIVSGPKLSAWKFSIIT
jgi:hypothetical protein